MDNICIECDKRFDNIAALKKHKRRNHVIRKCNECEKVYHKITSLSSHKKTAHLKNLLKCVKCPKTFIIRSRLIIHMNDHNGEHRCKLCEKSFETSDLLIIHENDCIKRFQCKKCKKIYKCRRSLYYHIHSFKCESLDSKKKSEAQGVSEVQC
uniref:C2H2-type domain-containing protein n=1 Tax=viral metagenome TaxID=1070528 RepID=A0A6C0JVJ2_9ZZZZ